MTDAIKEIENFKYEPGDTILVKVGNDIPPDIYGRITERLQSQFPGIKNIIVLGPEADLEILREKKIVQTIIDDYNADGPIRQMIKDAIK